VDVGSGFISDKKSGSDTAEEYNSHAQV